MTTTDIFNILQGEIHSTVFATLDQNGLPQTCVIDLMLADESGLYFLTARGKSFYDRLTARPFVAVSGMKGADTLSTIAVSVRGAVRSIGNDRLPGLSQCLSPRLYQQHDSPCDRLQPLHSLRQLFPRLSGKSCDKAGMNRRQAHDAQRTTSLFNPGADERAPAQAG